MPAIALPQGPMSPRLRPCPDRRRHPEL